MTPLKINNQSMQFIVDLFEFNNIEISLINNSPSIDKSFIKFAKGIILIFQQDGNFTLLTKDNTSLYHGNELSSAILALKKALNNSI